MGIGDRVDFLSFYFVSPELMKTSGGSFGSGRLLLVPLLQATGRWWW